jgi:protein SCO1/2
MLHTTRPARRDGRHPTTRAAAAVAVAAAAALLLAGCGGGGGDKPAADVRNVGKNATKPGVVLDTPLAKPDLVLTDDHGKPYDLVKETAGKPTLVYFGYTHCPDVCPTMMSDLAVAKSRLSKADQAKLRVVFVSTDPQDDTPKRLKSWLDGMDPSFVGLTGSFAKIQAGAASVDVDVEKPIRNKDGSVSSTHGAQVLAFSPKDNKAHVIYMAGTTVKQFAHDLPAIIAGRTP